MAAAVAVALAIGAMSLMRCLHPPGGAAALTAVLGGPAVTAAGFTFAIIPMALNCVILVGIGWLFHKLSRHSYPHRPGPIPANVHISRDIPGPIMVGFQLTDIIGALEDFGEVYDIGPEDLDCLLRRVETRAFERAHANLACADIMSRNVICIDPTDTPEAALALLLGHDVRMLPVIDQNRHVIGIIGLRELSRSGAVVADLMSEATTVTADQPASSLVVPLTDDNNHAVVVIDRDHRLVGIVTQIDLLTALAKSNFMKLPQN